MERRAALDFAARRGFGLLVAFDGGQPVGSHLPFVLAGRDGAETVQAHVTAANPLAALADGERRFLLAVSGPDAYVSNDYYASPDQVSTWLYEAVHLTGPARRLDGAANRGHGDALLETAEARLTPKKPWDLARMEPGKRGAMLGAIATLELTVEMVEGQRKLNQHKPDADHVAVVRALERRGNAGSRAIAQLLRAERPHLAYQEGCAE